MRPLDAHVVVVHAPTRPEEVMSLVSDELAVRWTWSVRAPLLAIVVLPRLSLVGGTGEAPIVRGAPVLRDARAWCLHAVPRGTERAALMDGVSPRPPGARRHPALDGGLIPVFPDDAAPFAVRAELRRLRERIGEAMLTPLHQDWRSGRLQPFHMPTARTPEA